MAESGPTPAAAPAATEAVLEVRGLSVDFLTPRRTVHALRDVSLSVPRGSIVGVVGESGSGKTTLASTAIRLLPDNAMVRAGAVLFEGRDVLAMDDAELRALRGRRMSMVFQDPMTALNPVLSIGAQMTDIQYRERGLGRAGKRRRAVDMLRRVGIPDPEARLDRYPHEFSGGMRQRILIAMALLARPALLIADEPTTALDVTMEAQIVHLLRLLQSDLGGSILFISHNLGLIAELCDRVVILYAGEVVEQGPVRDIFHRPAHPYTELLLTCDPARLPELTRMLPTIPGEVPDLMRMPAGCVFAPRCPRQFARCAVETPAVATTGPGHAARCHLLEP
ncbi:MAG: ABC transporter ATP-binding protein [Rhodospirillaceae bacterium]|nr:ABC transporter ATP-binding protein [Rhodospirillaceae bacterium]